MKIFAAIKLLIDLRRGWKSKTVIANRLLALVGSLDFVFFQGDIGGKIVDGLMWLVAQQPIFMFSREQVISFLVVCCAGLYQWLRTVTTEPVDGK